MLTKAPKGTKDILPSQIYKWHFLEKKFSDLCEVYGFKEMRTPVFEHTELFERSVGDTTDIVEKQMYTFKDYADRKLTLKPEGTAGIARSFVEHKLYAEIQPSKYYYQIPCFRYEKPQSGRLREFHQFGIEVFGTNNMIADAEVISLADSFLRDLGIKNLDLQINSIGCPECRKEYRKILKAFLEPKLNKLCETCRDRFDRNPIRILDCKSEVCQAEIAGAPMMLDHLCEECQTAFDSVKKNLQALNVEYTVNPGIVRGLDYYTKTAFEFVSNDIGAQGTVCGGGRYDNLIEELGGPPIPGVGFGMGIERLLLVMESSGIKIPEPETPDVLIAFMGESAQSYALDLLSRLRKLGVKSEIDSIGRNIKGQFKYADRIAAKYTLVIGDDEIANKKVSLKNMSTGDQSDIGMDAEIIKENLK